MIRRATGVAIAVAVLLAACGDDDSSGADTTGAPTTATPTTAAPTTAAPTTAAPTTAAPTTAAPTSAAPVSYYGENATIGVLAVLNLIAVMLLAPEAVRVIKYHFAQRAAGHEPEFDPAAFPELEIDPDDWSTPAQTAGTIQNT